MLKHGGEVTIKFQNRLIGTIALICLGIIILPDMFDGKKEHYQEQAQAIPLNPNVGVTVKSEAVRQPLPIENTSENTDIEIMTQTIPDIEPDTTKEKDILAFEKLVAEKLTENEVEESAWIIRLGTFKNVTNAKKLVETLQDDGYPAQLFPREPREGDFVRVEVGPDVSKQKLSSMIHDLEALTGLKGKLLRFDPLKS